MIQRCAGLLILTLVTTSVLAGVEQKSESWDGSRTTPVHRFPMYDENSEQIVPTYKAAFPLSTRYTCGTCHNYTTVTQGWHFNSSKTPSPEDATAHTGRPGEPWVLVDRQSGTQLPLSYRGWHGIYRPEEVGLSYWDFTRQFARHFPGSDAAEGTDRERDPDSRWDVSGEIEANCFACHNASPKQDPSEWAKQIARENFRWASTAASGLGDVNGMASRMPANWTIYDGPNKDDTEFAVAPSVAYNTTSFDSKNRSYFDIVRKPLDKNCLQCHSTTPVGMDHSQVDSDVHSRAGVQCADCHRNDLNHQIGRGYEGEAKAMNQPDRAEFTCRGCHLGETADGKAVVQGRMGAPRPRHAGLPPVHLQKMACTVCHSGPALADEPIRVRTSRANRLGIHGRAVWATAQPGIVEPVYVRNSMGVLEPHRMMWPAFWARLDGEKVLPLKPEQIREASKGVLDAEDQVVKVLAALAADTETTGHPVITYGKQVLVRTENGELGSNASGTTTPSDTPVFAWQDEQTVTPLIPSFEGSEKKFSSDAEVRLVRVLDTLAPLEPAGEIVIGLGDTISRKTLEGALETTVSSQQFPMPVFLTLVNGELKPLLDASVVADAAETVGGEQPLTERAVATVLARLKSNGIAGEHKGAEFAYISSGKLFRESNGKLTASDNKAAEPVSWPVGHNVRPATQSLGTKSCSECHSENSPFFVATINAVGPLRTQSIASVPMHEFERVDSGYHKLFGASFAVRSTFKLYLLAIGSVLVLVLLAFSIPAIRGIASALSRREK